MKDDHPLRDGDSHRRVESEPGAAEDPARANPEPTAAGPAGPGARRRKHRRAGGGRAPDPELAVDDPVLGGLSQDPDRVTPGFSDEDSERAHERWLKQQRPPHWG